MIASIEEPELITGGSSSDRELSALRLLAKELLNYPAVTLTKAIDAGELIKIEVNDDG